MALKIRSPVTTPSRPPPAIFGLASEMAGSGGEADASLSSGLASLHLETSVGTPVTPGPHSPAPSSSGRGSSRASRSRSASGDTPSTCSGSRPRVVRTERLRISLGRSTSDADSICTTDSGASSGSGGSNTPTGVDGRKKRNVSTSKPRGSSANSTESSPQSGKYRGSVSDQRRRQGGSMTPRSESRTFEKYLTLYEVQQGLKRGQLIEGVLRINPKNYEDAYISAPDEEMDIFISGVRDRNRALNGDQVVVCLNQPSQWKVLNDAVLSYLEREELKPSDKILFQNVQIKMDSTDTESNEQFLESLYLECIESKSCEDMKYQSPSQSLENVQDCASDTVIAFDNSVCENVKFENSDFPELVEIQPLVTTNESKANIQLDRTTLIDADISNLTDSSKKRENKRKRGKRQKKSVNQPDEPIVLQSEESVVKSNEQEEPKCIIKAESVSELLVVDAESAKNSFDVIDTKTNSVFEETAGRIVSLSDLSEVDNSDHESTSSIVIDLDQVVEDKMFLKSNRKKSSTRQMNSISSECTLSISSVESSVVVTQDFPDRTDNNSVVLSTDSSSSISAINDILTVGRGEMGTSLTDVSFSTNSINNGSLAALDMSPSFPFVNSDSVIASKSAMQEVGANEGDSVNKEVLLNQTKFQENNIVNTQTCSDSDSKTVLQVIDIHKNTDCELTPATKKSDNLKTNQKNVEIETDKEPTKAPTDGAKGDKQNKKRKRNKSKKGKTETSNASVDKTVPNTSKQSCSNSTLNQCKSSNSDVAICDNFSVKPNSCDKIEISNKYMKRLLKRMEEEGGSLIPKETADMITGLILRISSIKNDNDLTNEEKEILVQPLKRTLRKEDKKLKRPPKPPSLATANGIIAPNIASETSFNTQVPKVSTNCDNSKSLQHNNSPARHAERYAREMPKKKKINKKKEKNHKKAIRRQLIREDSIQFDVNSVLQHHLWPQFVQKTAFVVYISEKNHSRLAAGFIKPPPDQNSKYSMFTPRDHRMPRIRIPLEKCPSDFLSQPSKYEKVLFLARITEWVDYHFAVGVLEELLGDAEEIEAETKAILTSLEVDDSEYPPEAMADLPPIPYTLSQADLAGRRDFRNECVFTIDPITARDLDDALSCRLVSDNLYEVGVHISDVSHFLRDDCTLDRAVSKRATSVYLVQKVVHMLPIDLCLLCSLLPNEDKLTFSITWLITGEAEIKGIWFGKSIIRSCAKLAYEHAQIMIDQPDKEFTADELPEIHCSYTPSQLSQIVNTLYKISTILKNKRVENGALRIDQPSITFALDDDMKKPIGYSLYEHIESHSMIEEWMLLSNVTVAQKITKSFPSLAFLRRHPTPPEYLMKKLKSSLEPLGIHLNIDSAGGLQQSLQHYSSPDEDGMARSYVLSSLCARPMKLAVYFCLGCLPQSEDSRHYALSVPLYTHFTSPIRRYPDIVVHRLLGAAIGVHPLTQKSKEELHKIAIICNKRKYSAKLAQEQSRDLYLNIFISEMGPIEEPAIVCDIKDRSFDVLVYRIGFTQRVYINNIAGEVKYKKTKGIATMKVNWPPPENAPASEAHIQVITLFSIINIKLQKTEKNNKIEAFLVKPTLLGNGRYSYT